MMERENSSSHIDYSQSVRNGDFHDDGYYDDEDFIDDEDDGFDDEEDDVGSADHSHRSSGEAHEGLLSKRESQKLQGFQCVTTVLLFIISAMVVTATYMFLTREELNQFETAFNESAKTVRDGIHYRSRSIAEAFETRSQSMTSYALDTDKIWPFVKIPHFAIRGISARSSTSSELMGLAPFVSARQKEEWEYYSTESYILIVEESIELERGTPPPTIPVNQTSNATIITTDNITTTATTTTTLPWNISTSISAISNITTIDDENETPTNNTANAISSRQLSDLIFPDNIISEVINRFNEDYMIVPDTGPGPYLPIWQLSPLATRTDIINLSFLADGLFFNELIATMIKTNRSVISEQMPEILVETFVGSPFQNATATANGIVSNRTSSSNNNSTHASPHFIMFHPTYDQFDYQKRKIVASLFAIYRWDKYFSGLLPDGVNGIYCVLRNTCGQTDTFVINGRTATYLGTGDLHEGEFDYLAFEVSFNEFKGRIIEDNRITIAAQVQCAYEIHLYPSTVFQEQYLTLGPRNFTIVMGCAFLLAAMIFWSYVRYLQQRNNILMATAQHTTRIVSSLFPSNVRARIMEDAEQKAQKAEKEKKKRQKRFSLPTTAITTINNNLNAIQPNRSSTNTNASAMQRSMEKYTNNFRAAMHNAASQANLTLDGGGKRRDTIQGDFLNTRPIADLFPNCTVLFADIVGFTAWSSVREPTQVFHLLESIFHTFDEIANRRRIFKVETVGDCYVAVTGLPEPRIDHAVVMARFADEALTKMLKLVKKLEMSLGPDTADLTMRFGMHSGAVTAGVLRGEKSRFQLFGDTVNTAARMESNGLKDKIHMSQDTCDLLIAAGKSAWIETRKDKITAKGKGEMQTFWLDMHKRRPRRPGRPEKKKIDRGKAMTSQRSNLRASLPNLPTDARQQVDDLRRSKSQSNLMADDLDDDDEDSDEEGETDHDNLGNSEEGEEQTSLSGETATSNSSDADADGNGDYYDAELDDVQKRLVRWVVDLFSRQIKQIIAHRNVVNDYKKGTVNGGSNNKPPNRTSKKIWSPRNSTKSSRDPHHFQVPEEDDDELLKLQQQEQERVKEVLAQVEQEIGLGTPAEEMKVVVKLPPFDGNIAVLCHRREDDVNSIELDSDIKGQLVEYISTIATLYGLGNEFHNFAHASHVTMAVMKFISRITSKEELAEFEEGMNNDENNDGEMSGADSTYSDDNSGRLSSGNQGSALRYALLRIHERTYGISSDPLTQFAIVFSALIHDVDHSGVSNEQLVLEKTKMAKIYDNKCILEQNSIDLAWSILMDTRYEKLRHVIYTNETELLRFRSIVVNTVLATDILDVDLRRSREKRWLNVFSNNPEDHRLDKRRSADTEATMATGSSFYSTSSNDGVANHAGAVSTAENNMVMNNRATLVIEYLIQASDLAHTMQHWAIYRKWNEKLFREEYYAYLNGRCGRLDKVNNNDANHDSSSGLNSKLQSTDYEITTDATDTISAISDGEGEDNNFHPGDYWHQREIKFFNECVIPVARKLKECGVFGVYSDEYLECAIKNRAEWEFKGEGIVEEMVESVEAGDGHRGSLLQQRKSSFNMLNQATAMMFS